MVGMDENSPKLRIGYKRPQKKFKLNDHQRALILEHQYLVGRLVHRAFAMTTGHNTIGSLNWGDLASVAYYGLCVAASKYDPSKKIKFKTYAWATISGYIQHEVRDKSRFVKIPDQVKKQKGTVIWMIKEGFSFDEIKKRLEIDDHMLALYLNGWTEIPIPTHELSPKRDVEIAHLPPSEYIEELLDLFSMIDDKDLDRFMKQIDDGNPPTFDDVLGVIDE